MLYHYFFGNIRVFFSLQPIGMHGCIVYVHTSQLYNIHRINYGMWDGTFVYIYVRVYKGRDLLVGCVLVEIVDEMKGKNVIMAKREHFQQVLTTFRYNICFFFMACLKLEPYFFDGSKDFIYFCNQCFACTLYNVMI